MTMLPSKVADNWDIRSFNAIRKHKACVSQKIIDLTSGICELIVA